MQPNDLEEWEDYIAQLAGLELRVQTDTANSQTFVSMMADEGKDAAWCKEILMMLYQDI